jgi:hypothetical protein
MTLNIQAGRTEFKTNLVVAVILLVLLVVLVVAVLVAVNVKVKFSHHRPEQALGDTVG